MNKFFTDNFNISKITLSVLVSAGNGQPLHKSIHDHRLVLKLSGSTKYLFEDGHEMSVNAGDIFYLPKFSSYEVINTKGDCIAINFDLANTQITYDPFCFSPALCSDYERSYRDFLRVWSLKGDGYLNQCLKLLYSIICDIQEETRKTYTPSATKQIIDDAVEHIHAHIADSTLSVGRLSDSFGITPEYFRRLFRQVMGVSPRKYIIGTRIKNAKKLILFGEFSMQQISEMCGFESQSYFSKEFKKHTGCTPTEWARNN